jgi:hypothetical protein
MEKSVLYQALDHANAAAEAVVCTRQKLPGAARILPGAR